MHTGSIVEENTRSLFPETITKVMVEVIDDRGRHTAYTGQDDVKACNLYNCAAELMDIPVRMWCNGAMVREHRGPESEER